MTRELFIHKRVVRSPQIESIVIFANLALKKQPGFRPERLAQTFIDTLRLVQRIPENPTLEEVRHKSIRFRIAQHSPDLLFKYCRISKRPSLHSIEQNGIGAFVPDELRGAQRELCVGHAFSSIQ